MALPQFTKTPEQLRKKAASTAAKRREILIIEFEEELQEVIERIKKSEYSNVNKVYPKLIDVLTQAINGMGKDMGQLNRTEMTQLLNKVLPKQGTLMVDALAKHAERLSSFAGFSYQIEASMVHEITGASLKHSIKAAAIFKDALRRPIGATGDMLEPFIKNLTKSQVGTVEKILRKANVNGWTSQQTVQVLKGTRANGYADGLMARLGKQTATVVRTAMQHVNNSARQTLWAENADIVEGYKWVSTLDDRTSDICQELDGQVFKIDEGPIPPAHPNCRSTTIAVLDPAFDILDKGATRSSAEGYVPADMTYKEWEELQARQPSFPLFDSNSRQDAENYKARPTPFPIPPEAQKILDRMDFIESIDLVNVEYGTAIQFPSDPAGLAILDNAVSGLEEMHRRFGGGSLKLANLMDESANAAYEDNGSNRLMFNVNFFQPEAWVRWILGPEIYNAMEVMNQMGIHKGISIEAILNGIDGGPSSEIGEAFLSQMTDPALRERARGLTVMWNLSNNPKKTMYHEYGHHLSRVLRMKAMGKRAWDSDYKALLSMYGASKWEEFLAESVNLYMQGDTSQYWRIHPEILAKLIKADKEPPSIPFELEP